MSEDSRLTYPQITEIIGTLDFLGGLDGKASVYSVGDLG